MSEDVGYKYHRTSPRLVAVTSLWLWAVPDSLLVPPAGWGCELPRAEILHLIPRDDLSAEVVEAVPR